VTEKKGEKSEEGGKKFIVTDRQGKKSRTGESRGRESVECYGRRLE